MELIEVKAKFFDIQRAIDTKDAEIQQLIKLRQETVAEIERIEKA